MNQPNVLPQLGLFRDTKKFLGDYHQRALWIGIIQLMMSVAYLLGAWIQNNMLSFTVSLLNWKYKYNVEIGDGTVGTCSTLEISVTQPGLELIYSRMFCWMYLNVIRALFHLLSSFFLVWATCEDTPKICAIRFCNWARRMNLTFLLYEIVVFVVMYQEWKFAFCFILYRILFNHEVRGLLNTVQTLSPPPPGHRY